MSSVVTRRTVQIGADRLSVTIEDDFWSGLEEIAATTGRTTSQILALIGKGSAGANLASAIRVYVVDHFRAQADRLDDFDDDDDRPPPALVRPRWLN